MIILRLAFSLLSIPVLSPQSVFIPVCVHLPFPAVALELFQQVIHSTWENLVRYSVRLPRILPGCCPGQIKAG